jgi:fatty-acyl-CoA synthase
VRSFVVCGKPIAGHEIVIRGDNGADLGDREIGHILLKGPSLMAGYFENAEATQAIMTADGYMDTGDMGYWLDGEIVITGRAKDLILHNGRNIWPQDIEWAAEQIEPLRSGDAAAFAVEGEDGDDDVVVLIQCRLMDGKEMEELRRKIAAVVHQTSGVECDVVLVAPKSLPFTSSGKLSRAGAKDGYLAGEIAEISPLARVPHRPSGEARLHAAE